MLQAAQVVLIQDLKRSLQVNLSSCSWCDFATLGNFADYPDYPKCLQ